MAKTTINNIQLAISDKVRYTINGNADKYIELNPNDVGIVSRLAELTPKFNSVQKRYQSLDNFSGKGEGEYTDEELLDFGKNFKELDTEIRESINYLFDYDVSSVCAGGGSMFDMYEGEFRFVVIIDTLLEMYTDTIAKEAKKRADRIQRHTNKYIPQDHQSKKQKTNV